MTRTSSCRWAHESAPRTWITSTEYTATTRSFTSASLWRHTLIAYIPDLDDLTGMVADMLPPDATSKKSIVDAMRRMVVPHRRIDTLVSRPRPGAGLLV